jgi:hypothetical protein
MYVDYIFFGQLELRNCQGTQTQTHQIMVSRRGKRS